MNRRKLLQALIALTGTTALSKISAAEEGKTLPTVKKTKAQWREIVSPAAYEVLFEEGTEYVCAGCSLPLFTSAMKYESGTGWPSFYQALPGALGTKTDFKIVLPRTEYHCSRCAGHQGHVFDDGPKPTGKRYCNNGVALSFVARGDKLPALRT